MERTIVNREAVGATAHITQRRKLLMAQILIEHPTLIVVRQGRKLLRGIGQEWHVEPGMAVALAEDQRFDVVNTPDAETGVYEADWLACAPEIVTRFATGGVTGKPICDVHVLPSATRAFSDAFMRARQGIFDEDEVPRAAAIARIVEMLAWLDRSGGYFRCEGNASVSRRVRLTLSENLGTKWTAPGVAEQLGISEASLRRRLAEEGTSFSRLLIDTRMSRALTLLQVTDWPIIQIAFETGYESPSRFSVRFRERFGYCPSAVRTPDGVNAGSADLL
ncbi:helix-turn-helix transcriptional regulator [Azospirillum canadense]|uniref:helix-turn-helix transcriptional regulator n=1 Tax=Azospirillum canadense TaxID=403962 RepID=UPI0022268F84|nr:helix-turn-helix transcriptional regulator [Azospirillum canadense]MCW2240527.1 AraC-like DNA-binding protein [Azospirillum canadense]